MFTEIRRIFSESQRFSLIRIYSVKTILSFVVFRYSDPWKRKITAWKQRDSPNKLKKKQLKE